MTSPIPELAAVVARLDKVERQDRKLRRAGIAVLVLAAAGLLMGGQAMPKARTVEAESFVLKDGAGKIRAELNLRKDMPVLVLYDENGKFRVMLDAFKDGPGLILADENGKPRAALAVSKVGPALILRDDNGKTRAGLDVLENEPELHLDDETGKTVWRAP